MNMRPMTTDERGIALVLTLLVVLVIGALVSAAAVVGSNHYLVTRYYDRESTLESVADAGIELARARVNADGSLYPDSAYTVLEDGVEVTDADGDEIPGVQRWTYVGPTGQTSGQYGVFGSVVTVAEDAGGGRVVRRQQMFQESFAKFAYFTDNEGGNIYFASGDQIFGPVHSNDQIKIHSSGATFHDIVTTAEDVYNPSDATFHQGYEEYVPEIPMPETQELDNLESQAQQGNTAFTGDTNGDQGSATTRIEFIAVDIDGDGNTTDANEGFIRVYQSSDADWVVGKVESGSCSWSYQWGVGWVQTCTGGMTESANCGDMHGTDFIAAADHPAGGHDAEDGLQSSDRVCFLGGSDELGGDPDFEADDGTGEWLAWPLSVHQDVQDARPNDAAYLYPINRTYNPTFRGVIYVDGNVAISGTVRGQVTVAASGNIVIADDLEYVTDPGAGTCSDMLGMFAGEQVVVSDNPLNSPTQIGGSGSYYTFDETASEFIDGVVLALDIFTVENYNGGSYNAQPCEGTSVGRGCLYLTGGIIQNTRGAVGLTNGRGYLKRYSYDLCAAESPPPYFPTTGVFARSTYYHVDPSDFDIDDYWADLIPN